MNGGVNGGAGHTEMRGKVDQSGLAMNFDQIRNQLHIIFRNLDPMIFPDPPEQCCPMTRILERDDRGIDAVGRGFEMFRRFCQNCPFQKQLALLTLVPTKLCNATEHRGHPEPAAGPRAGAATSRRQKQEYDHTAIIPFASMDRTHRPDPGGGYASRLGTLHGVGPDADAVDGVDIIAGSGAPERRHHTRPDRRSVAPYRG